MTIAYLEDRALPASYYESVVGVRERYAPLEADASYDVCIVGAGLAGLQTAYALASRGVSVVVLEANRVGWGASGRNGGQVIPEFACGMSYLESAIGMPQAQNCYRLLIEGANEVARQVEALGIECEFQRGHLETAVTPQHAAPLKAWVEHARKHYGGTQRFIRREDLGEHIQSNRYYGGILDMDGGHLDPLRYTLGLARGVVAQGGVIHEDSPLVSWHEASGVVVQSSCAVVKAKTLILACNVGIDNLAGEAAKQLSRRILPVATWIVATAPLGAELASQLLPTRVAVADNRAALDYFRLSADNRLIFGGGASYLGDTSPAGHTEELRRNMRATFPVLSDIRIDYTWGGVIDATMSRAPNLGTVSENVYHLQCFSGSGLVSTAVAGRAVADAVTGKRENFQMFSRLPHRNFPGGRLLRGPIVSIAKTWVRTRDKLRIWGLNQS